MRGHSGLGSCCAECAQKRSTLGMLGWLPSGFGGLGNECVPGVPCEPYGLPPAPPLPAKEANPVVALDSTQTRALSIGGLLLNGLITAGGIGLWRKNHHVWGGILVLVGGGGAIFNIAGAVTGRPVVA